MKYVKVTLFFAIIFTATVFMPLVAGNQGQSIIHALEGKPETVVDNSNKEQSLGNEEKKRKERVFPESITVLDASETTPVNIKELPQESSKNIGIVYGNLMNVNVIKNLENGFSQISTWDYATMKNITGYVPTKYIKNVEFNEKYGVIVDISEQKVYIYENDTVIKTFTCSTGIDENKHYTPTGIYRIGDRGDSFFSPKYKQGGYYWVRFNNNYLFHSVPFDENRQIIEKEEVKLGQKASHGCVRLALDDARWFYNNIPRGTPVIIRD